jgi:hypothetical protein
VIELLESDDGIFLYPLINFYKILSLSLVLKTSLTINHQKERINNLLCRCATGVPELVGVTAPPDFFVRRLLKKLANAPSLVVRFASFGVVFLTK